MLKIGVCGRGGRGAPKLKGLEVFEIRASTRRLPSKKVCKRWKTEARKELSFLIQIPPEVYFPSGETGQFLEERQKVEESWKRASNIAKTFDAMTVVLSIPPQARPTSRNVENLKWFVDELVKKGLRIVVETGGMWSEENVSPILKEEGVVLGLEEPPPWDQWEEKKWAFLRYRGLGRGRLSGDKLYCLAEFCTGPWPGVCLLDVPDPKQDFLSLKEAMEELI